MRLITDSMNQFNCSKAYLKQHIVSRIQIRIKKNICETTHRI